MEAVDVAAPYADVILSCPWDSTATYIKETETKGSLSFAFYCRLQFLSLIILFVD